MQPDAFHEHVPRIDQHDVHVTLRSPRGQTVRGDNSGKSAPDRDHLVLYHTLLPSLFLVSYIRHEAWLVCDGADGPASAYVREVWPNGTFAPSVRMAATSAGNNSAAVAITAELTEPSRTLPLTIKTLAINQPYANRQTRDGPFTISRLTGRSLVGYLAGFGENGATLLLVTGHPVALRGLGTLHEPRNQSPDRVRAHPLRKAASDGRNKERTIRPGVTCPPLDLTAHLGRWPNGDDQIVVLRLPLSMTVFWCLELSWIGGGL